MPSTVTQTAGDRITSTSAQIRPEKPPMIAPLVVRPFQYMAMISTGKLVEAAMPKVRPTRNATFIFSNRMPNRIATMPRPTVAMRVTRISCFSLALPFLNTVA
ncbi:hypothetical protein D3C87_1729460 [compost metagenome]